MSDETRLERIEVKLAHLEHAVNAISDVVARQQGEIDRALQRARLLASQLESIETAARANPSATEKPPHY
jgi:SlyX protein